jgi:hypothetical protein
LPDSWLVAGSIAQTIWNLGCGQTAEFGIKDVDLIYFDQQDLSLEAEIAHERRLRGLFRRLPIKLDVKNEARVHLWYEERFGQPIPSSVATSSGSASLSRSLAAARRTAARKRSLSGPITVPPLIAAASLRCFPRRLVISQVIRRSSLLRAAACSAHSSRFIIGIWDDDSRRLGSSRQHKTSRFPNGGSGWCIRDPGAGPAD